MAALMRILFCLFLQGVIFNSTAPSDIALFRLSSAVLNIINGFAVRYKRFRTQYPVEDSNPYLQIRSLVFCPIELTGHLNGENGGDRTHDLQSHNLALFQLSYVLHVVWVTRDSNSEPPVYQTGALNQLSQLPILQRWEDSNFQLPASEAGTLTNCVTPLCFVRQVRLELTPGCPDYPLKVACLPFHHCRINVQINWFWTDLDRLHHCNSFKSRRTTANCGIAANQDIISSSSVIVGMEGLEPSRPQDTRS